MRRVLKKSRQLGKIDWDAVIRVFDDAGNVIETHEHAGDFKGPSVRIMLGISSKAKSRQAVERNHRL